MAIYRGPGGPGDAVADAASEAALISALVTQAQTAESNASSSASSASVSASSALSSASSASTSASNAASSAVAAATSASNAASSESNAASSASAASSSASSASSSASAASTSATNASNSASAASTSASNAASSASAASSSASSASTSANNAAASYDAFDDRYLGSKSSPPSVDNDGDALLTGALYWNSVDNQLYVWDGSSWDPAAFVTAGTVTSVDMTVPTGLTVSGNPITTAGTLAVSYTAGYAIPTTSSQSNWDTAYGWGNHATAGYLTSYTETDPIVGAINGIVKANGSGTISAATAGTDYLAPAAIGVTVQAYDADTAKLDVAQSFTAQQTFKELKDTVHTIVDGAGFEIDPANGSIQIVTLGANRTPAATNFEAGQIVLLGVDDGTAYTITWTTVNPTWVKSGGTASAPTLATSGYTWILLWKVGSTIYGTEVGQP